MLKAIVIAATAVFLSSCVIEPSYQVPHHLSSQLVVGSDNKFPDVDISSCGNVPPRIGPMDRKMFHGFDYIGPGVVKCIVRKRTEKIQCKPNFLEFLRSNGVICNGYNCGGNAITFDPKEKQISWIISFHMKLDPNLCISDLDASFTYKPRGSY